MIVLCGVDCGDGEGGESGGEGGGDGGGEEEGDTISFILWWGGEPNGDEFERDIFAINREQRRRESCAQSFVKRKPYNKYQRELPRRAR